VRRELREGLGFDGVTVSDDLEAPAFDAQEDVPARAARAGIDLLLYARTYDAADRAAHALAGAIRAGTLDRDDMNASLQRILALRAQLR
jgi:beta-N-acetylhexosaminidase